MHAHGEPKGIETRILCFKITKQLMKQASTFKDQTAQNKNSSLVIKVQFVSDNIFLKV